MLVVFTLQMLASSLRFGLDNENVSFLMKLLSNVKIRGSVFCLQTNVHSNVSFSYYMNFLHCKYINYATYSLLSGHPPVPENSEGAWRNDASLGRGWCLPQVLVG